jgi:DNA-binding CsgD family transcriptional regulator
MTLRHGPAEGTLRYAQVRGLLRLMREAGEIEAGGERRRHVMAGMLSLIGGDTAGLVDFPRAPLPGTPGSNVVLVGFSPTEHREALRIYGSTEGSVRNPALPAIGQLARRGPVTARREELIGDRDWYRSEYVDNVRRKWGIDHVMYATRVNGGGAVGFSFARGIGQRPFSAEERNLVQLLNEEFGELLRSEAPRHPLEARREALAPRVRQTLDLLLQGASSKEIAEAMGLAVNTVNQYVKTVFRAFGVRSRGELLARWFDPPRAR